MMELRSNIVGYHVNDSERCKDFLENKKMIFSADTHWLGYGMYFWDNPSNANYWVVQKKRKIKEEQQNIKELYIIQGNIFLDQLLDLTDTDILQNFEKLWQAYCEHKGCSKSELLGIKIDRLFDFYDELNLQLKVIKVHAEYPYTPKRKFLNYSDSKNKVQATYKIKTIYSVRDEECITNQKLKEVISI